tara:strand:- start:8808 stop:9362 length:555 start_codon:yes stop_codon:yes gene_type:complete
MINHRIFAKGEITHALLSSNSNPNILIPVKAIIKDVKYDDINPQYLIKVTKFYDTISFLKKHLFNMAFENKIGRRSRKLKLNEEIESVDDLIEVFNNEDEVKFYFVVDSIMCVKLKSGMIDLFSSIQDHLIERGFRESREKMIRTFYKGKYKLDSVGEFNIRLKRFLNDKFKSGDDFQKFTKKL